MKTEEDMYVDLCIDFVVSEADKKSRKVKYAIVFTAVNPYL